MRFRVNAVLNLVFLFGSILRKRICVHGSRESFDSAFTRQTSLEIFLIQTQFRLGKNFSLLIFRG